MLRNKVLLTAAAVFVVFAAGCAKKEEVKASGNTSESQGIQIESGAAKLADIKDKIKLVGVIAAYETTNVYSKASGKVVKFNVEEGQMVNKDDVIAIIDRDEVGFDFTQSPLKSPVSGMVLRRFVDVGNTISPAVGSTAMATPVVVVGNISKLKVQVSVIEEDIGRVKKGQEVEAEMESFAGKIFKGLVDNVSPQADPMNHASKVDVVIDNASGLLKPGVSAEVYIVTGVSKNTVAIPREALIRKSDERFVFAIENGKAKKCPVETGYDDGKLLEIKKGLKAGEVIAMSDFNVLQDGLKVKINESGK